MSKFHSSPEEQKKRCDQVTAIVTEYQEKHFNMDGQWEEPDFQIMLRERLYFALAFLRSGRKTAIYKANRIICNASYGKCTFSPMIALQILTKYKELLEEKSKEKLLDYVKGEMEDTAQRYFDYVGVNDNFPSMATYVLVIGGQVLEQPEMVQRGKERLEQFKALFTRRGVASEYNSLTYSPIQLLSMAELGIYARDPEIRKTARECEQRIWADCLGHLHKETCHIAGPYSRAYGGDSAGYTTSLIYCALYGLLGDVLPVNIMNTLLESEYGPKDSYAHAGIAFTQLDAVWLTDTVYSCPDSLLELAFHKQYPYEMIALTEFSSSTDMPPADPPVWPEGETANYEYPAGNGRISTYMTEDYALGVASHEFHNGVQTDSFHLLYRRRASVTCQKDIGAVYARYVINEKKPEQEMVLLEDNGRKLGIQNKNTAMMLYKPKAFLQKQVYSMKLSLVFPLRNASVEEVWLGKRRLEGNEGVSREPCSVFVKDGLVYMAFHPLLLTNHGREAAVTAKYENGYLLVSFYNYLGETRDFTMKEMLLTGNGFVAEIGSQREYGTFEDFRNQAGHFTVEDEYLATVHSRFTAIRKTVYKKGDLSIACEYSPVTEGIKQITVNGRIPETPKLSIGGFDCSELPFY